MDKFREIRPVVLGIARKGNKILVSEGYDKTKDELEDTINFLKEKYNAQFLIPQIIIYNKEHLNTVLAYLGGKRELQTVLNSPSILKLTVSEIVDREIFIRNRGEELTINGLFNPIFGWAKSKFEEEMKKQQTQSR